MKFSPYHPAAGTRDLRLDLLRGLCLVKMAFNHFWHTPVHFVQNWLGFTSAAAGFFFISGVVAGQVYMRRVGQQGLASASRDALLRACHLYFANLALVLLFCALEASRLLPYGFLFHAGFRWPELFAFNHPYALQVLPRYAVFLALMPLALWCLDRGRTAWLVGGSVGLWALNLGLGGKLALPYFEAGEFGGFLLIAWQMLFFVGMAVGHHRERLGSWWQRLSPGQAVALPAVLFVGFVLLERAIAHDLLPLGQDLVFELFGRDHLGAGRVVNLAVAFTFWWALFDHAWEPLGRWFGGWLVPMGQRALTVFLAHLLLLAVGKTVEAHLPFALTDYAVALIAVDALFLVLLYWLAKRRALAWLIPN